MIHMDANETAATPLELAIAKQIAVELVERDMHQGQLAIAVGTTPTNFSRYMNGRRSMPMPMFFKIADVLGIPADELLRRAAARLA